MIKVELIDHMGTDMRVEYMGHYGDDLFIANCARVSFNKWQEKFIPGDVIGSDERLIKFLARENHIMPFCHPQITMRHTAPIFVARQAQKHQVGFVWSELSRRYVDSTPTDFVPDGWRKRAPNKKQGSLDEVLDTSSVVMENGFTLEDQLQASSITAYETYEELLKAGVCPEQARMVLPQSMMTTWIWTGSLAAFARAYKLRIDPNSQKEIQDLAKLWDEIISPLFPVAWSALVDRRNEHD